MNKAQQFLRPRFFARFLRLTGLSAGAAFGFATAQAAQPTISQTYHQLWTKIAQATETVTPTSNTDGMGYPRAYLFQADNSGTIIKKVLTGWHNGADDTSFVKYTGWAGSTNGGMAWNAPSPTGPGANNPEMGQVAKRVTDGVLISVPVYPGTGPGGLVTSFTYSYHTSSDKGVSWTKHTDAGVIDTSALGPIAPWRFRFHRGILQDNDGTLYAPALLIQLPSDTPPGRYYALLMRSTNGGVSWHYWSTIIKDPGVDYSEPTVARCVDGSMLAVIRNQAGSTLDPLKYRRSTNNGQSWSGIAANLPGLPTNTGVDPQLQLMPNGILALTYGDHTRYGPAPSQTKRDIYLAFSADGNGASWTNATQTIKTFTANPTPPNWQQNSTGYTSILPVSAHRLMQFSDRAEKTYYYTNSQESPNPFSIWTKIVDVVPNHKNRIDLKGKYDAIGASLISTDLMYSNASFPEARATGAFDGVTDYWSGAFKTGTSGTYTIDLQEAHTLNAIGVCLHYAEAQSATIQISTNGSSWTTVKTYANAKHRSLDYTAFTAVSARYVRVTLTGAGLGGRVGLNEIELYSTADTYENYAQYIVPIGYTAPNAGFVVTGAVGYGYQSERTLYMNDGDGTTKTITKTTTATTSKILEFWVKPLAYAPSYGAVQFHINSGSATVYHLAVFSDGSVHYHTTAWNQIAAPGTVPLNTWTRIRVQATISPATASVYINGSLIGTAAKKGTATTMNGFLFGSGGSTPVGDQAFFDDVSFN